MMPEKKERVGRRDISQPLGGDGIWCTSGMFCFRWKHIQVIYRNIREGTIWAGRWGVNVVVGACRSSILMLYYDLSRTGS